MKCSSNYWCCNLQEFEQNHRAQSSEGGPYSINKVPQNGLWLKFKPMKINIQIWPTMISFWYDTFFLPTYIWTCQPYKILWQLFLLHVLPTCWMILANRQREGEKGGKERKKRERKRKEKREGRRERKRKGKGKGKGEEKEKKERKGKEKRRKGKREEKGRGKLYLLHFPTTLYVISTVLSTFNVVSLIGYSPIMILQSSLNPPLKPHDIVMQAPYPQKMLRTVEDNQTFYLFIYLFIYSFIYLFIYLFI